MFTKKSFLNFVIITLVTQNTNALPRLFSVARQAAKNCLTKPKNVLRVAKAKAACEFIVKTTITRYADDTSANIIYDNIKIASMCTSCWITNTKAFKWISSWFKSK